jgi:hypothetical protein
MRGRRAPAVASAAAGTLLLPPAPRLASRLHFLSMSISRLLLPR